MANNSKVMQWLTIISIVLTAYLIYRGARGTSSGNLSQIPGISPGTQGSNFRATCNLNPEYCLSVIAATCAIPLAADHILDYRNKPRPLESCGAISNINAPRAPLQTVGLFHETSGDVMCCAGGTSFSASLCGPVILPMKPRINTCVAGELGHDISGGVLDTPCGNTVSDS